MTELRAGPTRTGPRELRPWLAGDLLDNAAAAIGRHRRTALGVPLVAAVIVALLNGVLTRSAFPGGLDQALSTGQDGNLGAIAGYLVESIALAVLATVMSGLLALAELGPDRDPTTGAPPSGVLPPGAGRVLPGLIGTGLLVAAVLGLTMTVITAAIVGLAATGLGDGGVALAVLVGLAGLVAVVVLTVRLTLAGAVYALEGHRSPAVDVPAPARLGPLGALTRSWRLSRKAFWHTLGLVLGGVLVVALVGYAIQGGVASLVAILGRLVGGDLDVGLAGRYSSAVSQIAVTVLELSFVPAVIVMTYTDLRVRKEGLDLWLRPAMTRPTGSVR